MTTDSIEKLSFSQYIFNMTENASIQKIKYAESDLTWVSISNPDEKAVDYLRRHYKFHPLDLDDCLSEIQRPKIDDYENYLFMVLHIPVKTSRKKNIQISELKIFVGQNFIITLHDNSASINAIFEKCKKNKKVRAEYLEKGTGYLLYMIIDDLFESGLPLVDALAKHTNEMEIDVFDSQDYSRDRLRDILLLKKDIINFRRIIIPQRAIIAQLEHKNKKFIPENLDVYFDNIVDKIEKIWNNLENLQELVASLQETNESIISHNTNNVIKILTIISVIVMPLTFVTGFYGMNVGLPLGEHPYAVWGITGFLLLIAVSMISFFRYRKWL